MVERMYGASRPGGAAGRYFAGRMHQAAVADGSQQRRKRKVEPEHARPQIAGRHGYRLTRPERERLECPAVLAQRDFVFGAAVDVIEHRLRQAPPRQRSQVLDIDDTRRRYFARLCSHRPAPVRRFQIAGSIVAPAGAAQATGCPPAAPVMGVAGLW